jgi:hypothetical protein
MTTSCDQETLTKVAVVKISPAAHLKKVSGIKSVKKREAFTWLDG